MGLKEVDIYTDGACSGNPGPGGWGAVLLYGERRKELSGGAPSTTNNRMELTAVIEALQQLKERCKVNIYSDSAYIINCFHQGWYRNWQKNGWNNSKKQPVENRDLWEQLIMLTENHEATFFKVKGHSDNELNNRCDELATTAAKQYAE